MLRDFCFIEIYKYVYLHIRERHVCICIYVYVYIYIYYIHIHIQICVVASEGIQSNGFLMSWPLPEHKRPQDSVKSRNDLQIALFKLLLAEGGSLGICRCAEIKERKKILSAVKQLGQKEVKQSPKLPQVILQQATQERMSQIILFC